MDLDRLKELALDITKDTGNHEQTVGYLNDIVKYAEAQDLTNKSLTQANETYASQLEKARETNIKLFEQVTIREDVKEEHTDKPREYTEKDILSQLGED